MVCYINVLLTLKSHDNEVKMCMYVDTIATKTT